MALLPPGRTAFRWSIAASGEDGFYDLAVDVGETEVAALVVEGQALVVDAEEVEQGGVEVVDVNAAVDDVVAEVVGLAVAECRI